MEAVKQEIQLKDVLPDIYMELGRDNAPEERKSLVKLIADAKKNLNKGTDSINDVQKFIFAVLEQVAKDTPVPPKDYFGIPDENLEALYGVAHNLYENAKFDEAANIFRLLVMINHYEFKYLFGLAATQHAQREYMQAATMYCFAATLNPGNPTPHFHAAECYFEMGDPASAYVSLGLAVHTFGSDERYAELRALCEFIREQLEQDEQFVGSKR